MLRRSRTESDMNEELRFHVEAYAQDLTRSGIPREEAMRRAKAEFGGAERVKEECREARGVHFLETLAQDIRYALRMLRKSPGFTAVAVLTLALGIGANTAIFSLVDTVMLKMLPVQNPQQLVLLGWRTAGDRELQQDFSDPVWQQIHERQDVFSGMFAWGNSDFDLAQAGASHNIKGLFVSGDFFNTLGVRPAAGRLLTSNDDVRGCAGTAVLSYAFWQEHYAGAQSAIGSMISLNRHPFQVVGAAPAGFFGVTIGEQFAVAVPICAEALIPIAGEPDGQQFLDRPSAQWLHLMARPKHGVSLQKVSAGLQVISSAVFSATVSSQWRPEWQKEFLASTLVALPGSAGTSDLEDYNQPLKTLMAIVGLVLLIACANIASLMLARAATRRKEIAVRLAVGASRSRLIRQLLTECLLLSALGGFLGILLAQWGCALLVRMISTSSDPVFLQLSLNGRVLGFTAAIVILTGLLFGLLPALRSTRVSLTSAMKGAASEESQSRSHLRAGRWIVASQVALSLIIVVAATLFVRSFRNLLTLDLGFDRTNVLLIETSIPHPEIPQDARAVLNRQILDRLSSLPGVVSASESIVTPISGYQWGEDFQRESGGPSGDDANAAMNFVSPSYFATLRSPLIAGRDFDQHDVAGAQPVVIINDVMARRFFPRSSAVGQYLVTYDFMHNREKEKAPPLRIIGVLKDAKYRSLREAARSTVYFPIAQSEALTDPPTFEIRTRSTPMSLARPAEAVITQLNKNISLDFVSLETQVDDSLRQDQLLATLSGFFGGLALLLAMIGLYGVLAYMVTQRRKEIGIRLALGAQRSSILRLVLREIAVLLLIGVAAGALISLWATRLMQTMLFHLRADDAATILLSVAVLVIVALAACYIPAHRATKVDPMIALRYE
jgi:putative ABC transport system permease protein